MAPAKYEFSGTEGVIAPEQLAAVEPVFRELNLTQAQAQKLVDFELAAAKRAEEAHAAQVKQWNEDIKSDKELGGQNFDATTKATQAVLTRFGDDELRKALDATGWASYPPLVRFLSKIGRGLAPDRASGKAEGGGATGLTPEQFYPSMQKKSA